MGAATVNGTAIEWTHVPGFKGETWNPVSGCTRISPGCANCYARTMARRLKAMGQPGYQLDGDGPGFGVTVHPDKLAEPLTWKKPRAVFVNSMSDLFHDEIPATFIADVFDVMRRTPQHIYMVLTKRPEEARDWFEKWRPAFTRFTTSTWPLPNVWMGVSIENSRHTWRADVLREIPAAVRFISAEPLLGSLFTIQCRDCGGTGMLHTRTGANEWEPEQCQRCHGRQPLDLTGIDWVIVGGESGHGARPMQLDWAREIVDACLDHCTDRCECSDVPADYQCEHRPAVFVKQLGSVLARELGAQAKGGDWDDLPSDIRIREFPRSAAL